MKWREMGYEGWQPKGPSGAGNVYLTFDDPTHAKRDMYLIHIHYTDKTTTRLTVERR